MNIFILNTVRVILLVLTVCVPLITVANTANQSRLSAEQLFTKGASLIQQDNLQQGLPWLMQSASRGHAQAAFELALLYEMGMGVPPSFDRAKEYYEKAIAKGHRDAHINLALLLSSKKAPFNNLQEARNIIQVIAKRGDGEAQFVLATLLESTLGNAPPEPAKAIHWLNEAAKKDHAKAQLRLGMHHLSGQHINRDAKSAFHWLSKAANQGVATAQFNLALMYEKGDGTAANVPQALRWFESAANLGDVNAQHNLGIKYLVGQHVKPHFHKGLDLLTQAGAAGSSDSQVLLSRVYQFGYDGQADTTTDYDTHIAIDLERSKKWYAMAAKQGHPEAQKQLAKIKINIPSDQEIAGR